MNNIITLSMLLLAEIFLPEVAAGNTEAIAVNALADRYCDFRLRTQPEIAYFSGIEIFQHDGLHDNSPQALAQEQAFENELLGELERIDEATLTGDIAWITYGFLRQALTSSRDLRACRNELWAVNQMSGWQLNYVQLAALQPVGNPSLRQQALLRWRKLPAWIEQEILNLGAGLKAGYSSPKAVVHRVIDQLDRVLAIPAADSPFASPSMRDQDEEFGRQFVGLVREEILPAVRHYRDYLANEYLEKARSALAVTANPEGRACYEASLKYYTTLNRSPEEVYELGRRTVITNRQQVEKLGQAAYGIDDFVQIIQRIKSDPKDKFNSKQELLNFSRSAVTRAHSAIPAWFGRVPQRVAEVEPYAEYQDGTGVSPQYEPGNKNRPGIYRVSLHEPEEQSQGNLEATAFHEVWPGHHLQAALAQEIVGLHPITQITWYAGMGEGWARYSEALAAEMGLYTTLTGPILRLAWPARGMVADPGIHIMDWTREQAIEYMGRAGRMTETALDELVDRIAIMPGQLTSYDSGGLEILALRAMAKAQLGDAFDIREFHDHILENGTLPLEMLRSHIEDWLNSDRVIIHKTNEQFED
jgi:uncharacterized protein (DUF885 family)